jgi:hypothetical protein
MLVESFLGLALLGWHILVRKYRSFWEFHYGVFSARRGVFHGGEEFFMVLAFLLFKVWLYQPHSQAAELRCRNKS